MPGAEPNSEEGRKGWWSVYWRKTGRSSNRFLRLGSPAEKTWAWGFGVCVWGSRVRQEGAQRVDDEMHGPSANLRAAKLPPTTEEAQRWREAVSSPSPSRLSWQRRGEQAHEHPGSPPWGPERSQNGAIVELGEATGRCLGAPSPSDRPPAAPEGPMLWALPTPDSGYEHFQCCSA